MLVIPAVDLREGACVQLVGGEYADERVRLDDPLAVAPRVAPRRLPAPPRGGPRRGHRARLEREVVAEIVRHGGFDAVQVGGGVRDEDAIERLLDQGVTAVVIGTRGSRTPTGWSRWPSGTRGSSCSPPTCASGAW
jgi:phosphoribosylformimino-5-aminoimidazole carboxamide ribotide isomerase